MATGLEFTTTTNVTVLPLTDGAVAFPAGSAAATNSTKYTATTAAATTKEEQYLITVDGFETTAITKAGAVAVNLSGTAGLTGSATAAVLADSGSTAALVTNPTIPALVKGATEVQTLPSFTVTENFANDLGTSNVTIVASSGMEFDGASGTATGTGWTIGAPVFNSSNTKASFLIGTNPGTAAPITFAACRWAIPTTQASPPMFRAAS